MKVLILTSVFPPEVRSSANLMYELSESLHRRGHAVTVVTTMPDGYPNLEDKNIKGSILFENQNGVDVIRASAISVHTMRRSAILRGAGQLLNALIYLRAALMVKDFDVILTYSPPLASGLTSYILSKLKRKPYIFNVQDLVPQYAIDLGILKNRFIIFMLKRLEHFVYRHARFLTVHSKGNKDYLINEGIHPDKAVVIHNWVDTAKITPSEKDNEFRRRNNLKGKFVVLFAGMLGYAQDIDTIIESAALLKDKEDIVFLIVGDGAEKPRLINKAESLGIKNVVFLPFVSKDEYPEVVAASDVCLATLRKELLCPVVPSKIIGYMAAGRPVIASLPLNGDAPAILNDSRSGICVEPGNPERLAQAINDVYNDRHICDELGENGRKYAERYFDREKCIRKYESLMLEAVSED